MLTAREGVDDRVRGLDGGADDYLCKPFAFEELLARIKALQRRATAVRMPLLTYKDLTLDPATRTVTRGGNRIELTNKEYALLEYLMRHPGQVLSRTLILERVWDYGFDSFANVVDATIRRLRKAVDEGFEQPLIHTVRGVGYKIKAP